jgi:hypothetical protein
MDNTTNFVDGTYVDLANASFYAGKRVVAIKLTTMQGISFSGHDGSTEIDNRHVLLADPKTQHLLRSVTQKELKIYYRQEPPSNNLAPSSAMMAFKIPIGQTLILEDGSNITELTDQDQLLVDALSGEIVSTSRQTNTTSPIDPLCTKHIYRDNLLIRATLMQQPFQLIEQGATCFYSQNFWLVESFEFGRPGKRIGMGQNEFSALYEKTPLEIKNGILVQKF